MMIANTTANVNYTHVARVERPPLSTATSMATASRQTSRLPAVATSRPVRATPPPPPPASQERSTTRMFQHDAADVPPPTASAFASHVQATLGRFQMDRVVACERVRATVGRVHARTTAMTTATTATMTTTMVCASADANAGPTQEERMEKHEQEQMMMEQEDARSLQHEYDQKPKPKRYRIVAKTPSQNVSLEEIRAAWIDKNNSNNNNDKKKMMNVKLPHQTMTVDQLVDSLHNQSAFTQDLWRTQLSLLGGELLKAVEWMREAEEEKKAMADHIERIEADLDLARRERELDERLIEQRRTLAAFIFSHFPDMRNEHVHVECPGSHAEDEMSMTAPLDQTKEEQHEEQDDDRETDDPASDEDADDGNDNEMDAEEICIQRTVEPGVTKASHASNVDTESSTDQYDIEDGHDHDHEQEEEPDHGHELALEPVDHVEEEAYIKYVDDAETEELSQPSSQSIVIDILPFVEDEEDEHEEDHAVHDNEDDEGEEDDDEDDEGEEDDDEDDEDAWSTNIPDLSYYDNAEIEEPAHSIVVDISSVMEQQQQQQGMSAQDLVVEAMWVVNVDQDMDTFERMDKMNNKPLSYTRPPPWTVEEPRTTVHVAATQAPAPASSSHVTREQILFTTIERSSLHAATITTAIIANKNNGHNNRSEDILRTTPPVQFDKRSWHNVTGRRQSEEVDLHVPVQDGGSAFMMEAFEAFQPDQSEEHLARIPYQQLPPQLPARADLISNIAVHSSFEPVDARNTTSDWACVIQRARTNVRANTEARARAGAGAGAGATARGRRRARRKPPRPPRQTSRSRPWPRLRQSPNAITTTTTAAGNTPSTGSTPSTATKRLRVQPPTRAPSDFDSSAAVDTSPRPRNPHMRVQMPASAPLPHDGVTCSRQLIRVTVGDPTTPS